MKLVLQLYRVLIWLLNDVGIPKLNGNTGIHFGKQPFAYTYKLDPISKCGRSNNNSMQMVSRDTFGTIRIYNSILN